MKKLNEDYKTILKVYDIESKLAKGEKIENLPDGITIREENGTKIIQWNMVTDFENLSKQVKITKRLKLRFGGDFLIPEIERKHKKGLNEMTINPNRFSR